MQHMYWNREPRIGDYFGDRNRWQITAVEHRGGTHSYKLTARGRFAQGEYQKEFSASTR